MKKRLIFCTGNLSALLASCYLDKEENCINYLLHISHAATTEYIEKTEEFIKKLNKFSYIKCANYCVYENSDINGVMNTQTNNILSENKESIKLERFKSILNNIEFNEILCTHYLSNTSKTLMKLYKNAAFYIIEEGLNSYFRKYKSDLKNSDINFLNQCKGFIYAGWNGIDPLFNFNLYGIKKIKINRENLIKKINILKNEIKINIFNEKCIVIIGQNPRYFNEEEFINEYSNAIKKINKFNLKVYFIKHPRDISNLSDLISKKIDNLHVLDKIICPIELLINQNVKLLIGTSSTALMTCSYIYNIPSAIIEPINNYNNVNDFDITNDILCSKILCSCTIPNIDFLTKNFNSIDEIWLKYSNNYADNKKIKEIFDMCLNKDVEKTTEKLNIKNPYSAFQLYKLSSKYYNCKKYNLALKYILLSLRFKPYRVKTIQLLFNILLKKIKIYFFYIPEIKNKKIHDEKLKIDPYNKNAISAQIYFNLKNKNLVEALYYNKILLKLNILDLHCYRNYIYIKIIDFIKRIKKRQGFLLSICMLFDIIYLSYIAKKENKIYINNNIASISYRPNRGASGGPGGVLFLEKELVGNKIENFNHDIYFRGNENYFDWFADVFSAARWTNKIVRDKKYLFYIVHDLGCAYMLSLMHQKYILVWHFQGSFVTQYLNFGYKLNILIKSILKHIEKKSFSNAIQVYFPSNGAKEMYFADHFHGAITQTNIGLPLYNTIIDEKNKKSDINNLPDKNFNGITFVSIGTQTKAKGQDNVIKFFRQHLNNTNINIRWITIGDGVLFDNIKNDLKNLSNKFKNFSYIQIKKINHTDVLKILDMSDVYIMLHRISIFDFATLEAMKHNCAVILSKVGGNLDFNKNNNIIFENDFSFDYLINNLDELKQKNKICFDKFFSEKNFRDSYIKEIINNIQKIKIQ